MLLVDGFVQFLHVRSGDTPTSRHKEVTAWLGEPWALSSSRGWDAPEVDEGSFLVVVRQ